MTHLCTDMPDNLPEPRAGETYTPVEMTPREAQLVRWLYCWGDFVYGDLQTLEEIAGGMRDFDKYPRREDALADAEYVQSVCDELKALVARGLAWHKDGKFRCHVVGFNSEMRAHYKAKYPQYYPNE
jgi:hypothetical protein